MVRLYVVLALLVAGLTLLLTLGPSWAHRIDARERVHEYNGNTWIGDACYVKDEVLWCEASG